MILALVTVLALAASLSEGGPEGKDARGLPRPSPAPAVMSSPAPSPSASPAPPSSASPAPPSSASPAPASVSRAPAAHPLDLGPYRPGPPGQREPDLTPADRDALRFESHVDVFDKAPLTSAALTARLEWWLKDFDPNRGATPGGAPTVRDTRDFRPTPAPSADLTPVLRWLLDQLNKKKE